MHRIAPVLVFLLVIVSSCSSDGDTEVSTADTSEVSTETTDVTVDEEPTTVAETTEPPPSDASSTSNETAPPEESIDEVGPLCDSYLASITPATFDVGLDELAERLGGDAPTGVLGAIDTLENPNGDIEAFFTAQNTIDGYVLPICRARFSSDVEPVADDTTAANQFLAAVTNGDRAGAERLAPDNVIVQFDWNGYPDATSDFSADNSTFTMLLEPTVTVFCQAADGTVEFCAFGE
jgi:hypothetical protein